MRWNCPHCEELVTAGIDFENTKKAYVRCAKCNGMALIHRSAVLADYVKARRLEEEAQVEAELRLTQSATAQSRMQTMEVQIRGLNERLQNERMMNERLSSTARAAASHVAPSFPAHMPPLPNAAMMTSMDMAMDMGEEMFAAPGRSTVTPPPFRPSFEAMEEGSMQTDAAPAAPTFAYKQPPAFLMQPTAAQIETIEHSFAIDDEITASLAMNAAIDSDTSFATPNPSIRANAALWIAAALAISSGVYLYHQGKAALAPTLAPAIAAPAEKTDQSDEIHSKAGSSALRAEPHSLVIVRVAKATLREGPTLEAAAIQSLDRAAVANLVETKDGWMKIESPQIPTRDQTAWIRADLVARMPN
jgi:hypothetical protein